MIPHCPRVERKTVDQLVLEYTVHLSRMGITCTPEEVREAIWQEGRPVGVIEEIVSGLVENERKCGITIVGLPPTKS